MTRLKKFLYFWSRFYFAMNVKYENVCNFHKTCFINYISPNLHILFNKYFLQRITSNNMEQKRVGKGKIYFAKTVFVCPANDNKNSKEPYSSKCKNGVCWLATFKHFYIFTIMKYFLRAFSVEKQCEMCSGTKNIRNYYFCCWRDSKGVPKTPYLGTIYLKWNVN